MNSQEKIALYEEVLPQIFAVLSEEKEIIAQMATISCLLSRKMPYFFWTGFYQKVLDRDELVVGPYQGTLGCLRIPFSRGVCGACAQKQKTIIVPDVHTFSGHIACDSKTNSEIVLPVFNANKELIAVFDVDSTEKESFCEIDQKYLEKIMKLFE